MKPLKLCRVVTVPYTFRSILYDQIKDVVENKFELILICSPGTELDEIRDECHIRTYSVRMSRTISPLSDLRALFQLSRILRIEKFDIIHSYTPKAGLLSAIAGRLVNCPLRVHTYTGQTWVEMHGLARWLARSSDMLIGRLNTACYADSHSQRRFLIDSGVIDQAKIKVLSNGSISGVDLARFNPTLWKGSVAEATRRELGIPQDVFVILFVGRITRDKGISELVSAFSQLAINNPSVQLVLVGPRDQPRGHQHNNVIDQLVSSPKIHLIGYTHEPEKYMGIADVLCLPSYREGFGSVVIEAAAMGIPAVATRIVGLVDAVEDGITGLLVPPKDAGALASALQVLISDHSYRDKLGRNARERATLCFDAKEVNKSVIEEYYRLAQ